MRRKGDEYLTKEQINMSTEDIKKEIEKVEKSDLPDELKLMKIKELKLVLRIKIIQDRMDLEEKSRKTLNIKRVSGKFYPDDVAKVIGTTKRQAEVIEKKALAKLKSPRLGKQLREVLYE